MCKNCFDKTLLINPPRCGALVSGCPMPGGFRCFAVKWLTVPVVPLSLKLLIIFDMFGFPTACTTDCKIFPFFSKKHSGVQAEVQNADIREHQPPVTTTNGSVAASLYIVQF